MAGSVEFIDRFAMRTLQIRSSAREMCPCSCAAGGWLVVLGRYEEEREHEQENRIFSSTIRSTEQQSGCLALEFKKQPYRTSIKVGLKLNGLH